MYKETLMNKYTNQQNRIRGTEACKRGGGKVATGWKKVKGLVKEYKCMTHGHGQGCGGQLWEWGEGWVRADKGEKIETTVNSINNKIFKKNK